MLVFRLLKESVIFAWHALVVNKLRALLSLLGITIGIFAIISVFTLVDTLERGVRDSVDSLGDDVVFIEKWPWGGGSDYPWWKYWQRPSPTVHDLRELEAKNLTSVKAACFTVSGNRKVEYKSTTLKNIQIQVVSEAYSKVKNLNIVSGRFISFNEFASGRPAVVIGHEIAMTFFNTTDCIGKIIKVGGRKVEIVGVFAKEGASLIGNSMDNVVLAPVNFARAITSIRDDDGTIMVKAKDGVSNEEMKDELTGAMRSIRRLRPKEDDNFALNESSLINSELDGLFGVINIAGLVIGLFSILVGGFSIANIMFVSVKERTNLIGIQKSLGAKNYFILAQFLFESVFLCLVGGLLGLFLVFVISAIASLVLDMNALLSIKNIAIGLGSSVVIGLVSGVIPAWSASRLDPVEAIRSN